VVLAHGGWGVLWAAQTLWYEKTRRAFPDTQVTNIGREKLSRYEKQRENLDWVSMFPFIPEYAGDWERGYFLNWLSDQKDWQDGLRTQVLNILAGKQPRKILVLDDTEMVGGTYRLILGLLRDIFPECETRMIAGHLFEWRNEIIKMWLLENEIQLHGEKLDDFEHLIFHFLPGTEDIDKDSLNWQPVTKDSKLVHDLFQFLPVETLLSLPKWAENRICNEICAFSKQGKYSTIHRASRPVLQPEELIIKYVWRNGKITRLDAAAELKITPIVAGKILAKLTCSNELYLLGVGQGAYFVLPPHLTLSDPRSLRRQSMK